MKEIYFDNSATTPLSEAVKARMKDVMERVYGNPSSLHAPGLEACGAVASARRAVLSALGAKDLSAAGLGSLIFTGSGTEANNLAIFGTVYAKPSNRGKRIVASGDQHPSVLEPLKRLESEGYEVAYIPTRGGELDLGALTRALNADTILVSVMLVNNETGALYDVGRAFAEAKRICPNAAAHTDAVQAFMRVPFTPDSLGADLITVSSHKINGPKGVGALYVSKRTLVSKRLVPHILGGGQEGGMRSGTENVIGIAGFAEAAAHPFDTEAVSEARAYLVAGLPEGVTANVPRAFAPHIISLTLPGVRSETMLHFLSEKGIYISSGSACSSHSNKVSRALTEFGIGTREAGTTVRISLGRCGSDGQGLAETKRDIDAFLSALAEGLPRLTKKA